MAHFAKVVGDVVTNVIVAEPEFFDTYVDTSPGQWIQTSYNTYKGVHALGSTPLRGNFAGIGTMYDAENDIFIAPKPVGDWILDIKTASWIPAKL
jgi:hypothetical protein